MIAPILLGASKLSAKGLGAVSPDDDEPVGASEIVQAKQCKPGYVWNKKKRRCVPAPQGDLPDCFVTTACCNVVGLRDDCFELAELRRFRETVMRKSEDGKRVIDEYSIIGPQILRSIPEDSRFLVLCNFYAVFVLPCVLLSRLGSRRTVMKLYAYGTARLLKKYSPEAYAIRAAQWNRAA